MQCRHCDRTDEDTLLQKCPICHKHFCEDHEYVMSGHRFCTQRCGEYFFFADPEDED